MRVRVSTEDERHAVRPALLETEQRACDAHGAADHAALVDHVAPVHKVPAICELDLAGAVWREGGAASFEGERLREVDVPLEEPAETGVMVSTSW